MNCFKFCPSCGSQTILIENNRRLECLDCGLVFFQNVAAAVAVIIEREGQILFTVRNREPKLGMLDLPGGFCDPDETAEEACVREINEELGWLLNPENLNYFKSQPNDYVYRGVRYKTEDLIFWTRLETIPELRLQDSEIQSVKWIQKEKIDPSEIGFDSLRKGLIDYLNSQNDSDKDSESNP